MGELVLLVLDAVEEQRTKAMSYGMSLRLRAARAARAEGGIFHEAEIIGDAGPNGEELRGVNCAGVKAAAMVHERARARERDPRERESRWRFTVVKGGGY